MGMGVGRNGNNQREWEGNGNKTRLNLGSGMGIGMRKTFALISTMEWSGRLQVQYIRVYQCNISEVA